MVYLTKGNRLVSTGEAAQRLGINRSTLLRWIAQGEIPATRIGRSFKIALQDLERVPHNTTHPATHNSDSRQAQTTESTTPPSATTVAREVMMFSDDLTQLHQRWLDEMRARVRVNYSDATIKCHEYQFQRYMRELSTLLPHRGITYRDVIDPNNVADVLGRIPPSQHSTRYQVYFAVVVFCRFLENRKLVEPQARLDLRPLKPRRKGNPTQTFFKDSREIQKFFDSIWLAYGNSMFDKQLVETACKMMLNTGVRRAELCNLLLRDVSLERAEIFIRCGKGGHSRRLGINRALRSAMEKYLKVRPSASSGHFFVNEEGSAIIPEYLSRRVRRIARRAGLEVSCHSFRRTMATRMALGGHSLPLIQAMLGHADETMTNQYIQLQERNIVESMRDCDTLDPCGFAPVVGESPKKTGRSRFISGTTSEPSLHHSQDAQELITVRVVP